MPQSSRTFRIFISSTFSDLKVERNALQERVFPPLRELAIAHGCRFQAIDLRWGVSEEAALNQQTMKICLGEIGRCQRTSPRPNFIILLGDRYGWQPLPYAIPAAEFELLLPHMSEVYRNLACWSDGQPAEAQGWYRLDENAVPPEYILLPRQSDSRYADYAAWESQVERALIAALEQAAQHARLSTEALEKYTLSATGQEIVKGALQVEDASEHVFCYFREITGLPQDENGSVFRDAEPGATQKQVQLKARLKKQLPHNTHEYKTAWQGDSLSLNHLDTLCNDVYADLSNVILSEIGQLEAVDPLDKENTAHLSFAVERARRFVGRLNHLEAISDYLGGREPQPLAAWGASGSGKSALLAQALQNVQKDYPQAVVIARFIGATPNSSNGRALLEDLCRQITRAYEGDERSIPTEYRELVQAFPKCLALAISEKPLIVLLDALDQLSPHDRADELAWLPAQLPEHVRLVVSTLPGKPLDLLTTRLCENAGLQIQAMSPAEGAQVLDAWLDVSKRRLTDEQRQDILFKFEQGGGLPLFMKLAFEEALLWHSYDGLPLLSGQQRGISADIPGVLHDLFWRLEQESNHGKKLVAGALGYLVASKNGLSEDELLDVLWADPDVRADFFLRSPKSPKEIIALPVVVWSRLYLDLEPYLTWRQADGTELLGFYHRQVREAVEVRYNSTGVKADLHKRLAAYFGNPERPFWLDAEQRQPDRRKTAELAHQQAGAGLAAELSYTLTTFDFLNARLASAGVEALIGDYDMAVSPASSSPLPAEEGPSGEGGGGLHLIHDGLRLSSHILAMDDAQLPSQLFGRLQGFGHPEIQRLLETTCAFQIRPWLRPLTTCLTPPGGAELRTFTGHSDWIISVKLLPDGKRAISASNDSTLKLWDLDTGAELRTFTGHTDVVREVAVLPDGKRAISASNDSTLKLWDLETGAQLLTFTGHTDAVRGVAVIMDGRHAISASSDKTLRLWDLETGAEVRTFIGHKDAIQAVTVLMDGKRAISASWDNTFKLWDLDTGIELRTFTGHTNWVSSVAVLADGKRAISASCDHTLKLWNLETGAEIHTFKGHTSMVWAVAVQMDGKRAISASNDHSLKLWDLENGVELRSFNGHTDCITSVAILADGRRAISSSYDLTLKLWDLRTSVVQTTLASHTNWVSAMKVLADGKLAISTSWDKTLKLWDLETCTEVHTFTGHRSWVTAVALLSDSRRAISASMDSTLKLWDLETGAEVLNFAGHINGVTAIVVLADRKRALSASDDKTLKLWNLDTGTELRTFTGHTEGVTTVMALPDGKRAISASGDCTLKLWDLVTGTALRTFTGHTGSVNALAVLSDGKRAISASTDCTLKLWNLETGAELRTMTGHMHIINAVIVLADDRRVLSASQDNTLKLWNLETGKALRTYQGSAEGVNSMTYEGIYAIVQLADGKRILSASGDNTLKLWDLDTGECLQAYYSDGPLTACSAVSNSYFIAGDKLGRVHLLRLEGNLPISLPNQSLLDPPIADQKAKSIRRSFFDQLSHLKKTGRS